MAAPNYLARPMSTQQALSWLCLILLLALLLRCALWVGFMGSDEVTYLQSAMGVLSGEWPRSDYIGALRYGVNIPMAAMMALAGVSESGAALWGLSCSVLEVAVVFALGRQLAGVRTGLFAALLLALMPVHVHFATRMMADPALGLFVSVGMWMLVLAEQRSSHLHYLLSGLAFGAAYWVKESGMYVSLIALTGYALVLRRFHWRWAWLVLGLLLMVGGNMLLMWVVQGDPLHIQRSIQRSMGRIVENTSRFFYLKSLLLDVRHIGLSAWLALCGLLLIWRARGTPADGADAGAAAVARRLQLTWLFGFLLVLSALPLRQHNYMLLFAAPLAVFGGYALAVATVRVRSLALAVMLGSGLVLALLQQASVRTFSANAHLAVAIANQRPDAPFFGSTGAVRADQYTALLHQLRPAREPIQGLASLDRQLREGALQNGWVLRDPMTEGWGDPADADWSARLQCLEVQAMPGGLLPELSAGERFAGQLVAVAAVLPAGAKAALERLLKPREALLFRVMPACRLAPAS
ncbi:glycosyltransferase family 39 protein [Paucibacter sediminis]|uniref:Glycosyltransferase family 39 protein n=1 Tax=Paucibacter sediminis TaxID=3019553 RepID=A0AA95NBZ9_9BURK|nr:glycosyltransferase family 39 protein [Paucibacter sp. S2-9]WIT11320.1 glycosyltransferase family 39 protein [Paucibacter sp. S2-9]